MTCFSTLSFIYWKGKTGSWRFDLERNRYNDLSHENLRKPKINHCSPVFCINIKWAIVSFLPHLLLSFFWITLQTIRSQKKMASEPIKIPGFTIRLLFTTAFCMAWLWWLFLVVVSTFELFYTGRETAILFGTHFKSFYVVKQRCWLRQNLWAERLKTESLNT